MFGMLLASFKYRSALPALALALLPAAAFAQSDPDEILLPGGVMPANAAIVPQNPADALTYNLGILARNPRDVGALTQAGISALAVGDANAAIGFLGRAEQLSPSNGRIKLSLGSALVMLERPTDAMHFFDEATALGVAEADVARDRGLAWDLKGDSRRAQRDYDLALRYRSDDETIRRLALSHGISGDKDQALKLLEPLIKRQDQAAWRNRAFILAMSGDLRGAERIVEQVMPYGMTNTMNPFLRRLASLGPADKAKAVNFGTMPSDGMTQLVTVDPESSFRSINGRVAESLTTVAQPVVVAENEFNGRKRKKDRRRPGRDNDGSLIAAAEPLPAPAPVRPAAPVALPPVVTVARAPRAGERIGPVNPDLIPPEARAGVSPVPTRAVLLPGNTLPPPSGVAAPVRTAAADPAAVAPPPLFELPPKPVLVAQATPVPVASAAPKVEGALAAAPMSVSPMPVSTAPNIIAQPLTPPKVEPAPQAAALTPTSVAPNPAAQLVITAPKPEPVLPEPVQVALSAPPRAPLQGPPAPGFDSVSPPSTSSAVGLTTSPVPDPQQGLAPAPLLVAPPPNPVTLPPGPAPATLPAAPAMKPVGLAAIMAGVETENESAATALNVEELRKARLKAEAKVKADAKAKLEAKAKADAQALAEAAELEKQKKEKLALAEKKKNPQRYWVQVGTGNSRSGVPITFKKLRDQAPDALKGTSAGVVPFKATKRLLVGPFKSQADARAKVNELAKKGITATTFTSDSGQEVEKVASK